MRKVSEYYDAYASEQQITGINKRHLTIMKWLKEFGLKNYDQVLEIGCGIGTQTELIAKEIPAGKITAIDISPKSIEIAKTRLKKFTHIELLAGDIIELKLGGHFDIIVLPDVLEHIPIEQHDQLFRKLASLLKPNGYIFIHIPNPYYLEWSQTNTPELLQIIDQPIYTDILCKSLYKYHLYIHYLNTYSIWIDNCDYQAIVVKPVVKKEYAEIVPPIPNIPLRVFYKLRTIFR